MRSHPSSDHQAITDSRGANLIGADESLSTVPGVLILHDLGGQRLPGLNNVAQVVEELLPLIARQALDEISTYLTERSGVENATGRVVRIYRSEIDDSVGGIPNSSESS